MGVPTSGFRAVLEDAAAALTGPNIAREIMAGKAAAAVVATEDRAVDTAIQKVVTRGVFRVHLNHDLVGCEIGGALKNVIAIAAGSGRVSVWSRGALGRCCHHGFSSHYTFCTLCLDLTRTGCSGGLAGLTAASGTTLLWISPAVVGGCLAVRRLIRAAGTGSLQDYYRAAGEARLHGDGERR